MFKKTLISLVFGFAGVSSAVAAPLVIDTDQAKVIVIRPLDIWSGDKSALESSLEAHKDKTAWYTVLLNSKKYLYGNPNLTQSATRHPITLTVESDLGKVGFSLPRNSNNSFTIQMPVSIPSNQMNEVLQYQAVAFRNAVIAQGNPAALQDRTSGRKFLGGIFALGTTLVAADKLGAAAGTHATLGSGITEGVYNLATKYKGGIVPLDVGQQDFDQFKEVEIRKVTTANPDRTGQIIIAYKAEKTTEAEEIALAQAVVALTGAQSTTEEIERARADDYTTRKAIWEKCVADQDARCKQ